MIRMILFSFVASIVGRLEFKPGGEAILWTIMLGGLLLGVICLCILDYLRDRVNRFLPLLPSEFISGVRGVLLLFGIMILFAMLAECESFFAAVLGFAFASYIYVECSIVSRRRREVAGICSEIAEALRRRLPVDEFFLALSREYPPEYRDALTESAMRVRDGSHLSMALDQTGLFAPETIASIHESELSGGRTLAEVLSVAAAEQISIEKNRARLRTALLYPLFIWTAILPLAAFVARFALPRLHFVGAKYNPVPPRFYSAIPPAVIVVLGIVAIFASFDDVARTNGVLRRLLIRVFSYTPFFSHRMRHRCLARAIRTLVALTSSDIPLSKAFRRIANPDIAGPYAEEFQMIGVRIERGESLSSALKKSGLPESFVCLTIAGAKGGTLAEALVAAADWHASRADRLDRIFVAALPCITIPLAGALVGIVYGSVFWQLTSIHEFQLHQLRFMQ